MKIKVRESTKPSLGVLFRSFLKIGTFTLGGGYAMIPLIEREVVERRRWVERGRFLELLALAQSVPGPIALNAAVFVGYRTRGFAGAVASVAGVVVPSFGIILLVVLCFADVADNRYVAAVFRGVRPAVVALIVAPVVNFARGMAWWKIALAVMAAVVVWRLGVSPMYFIAAGAAAGLIHAFYAKR